MARAPFQILAFPYRRTPSGEVLYALFRRGDDAYWQGIAGGGEDGETPRAAAIREVGEEAGLDVRGGVIQLESTCSIPVVNVGGFAWGETRLVIPEHSFGVAAESGEISLSAEHSEFGWFSFDRAIALLKWDSNKTALWELNHRLLHP